MEEPQIDKRVAAPTGRKGHFAGMTVEELMQVFSLMYLSRKTDEKIIKLLKQGKVYFHIGCAGHEAVQIAFALSMKTKVDWAFPYYRDLAFVLGMGVKVEEIFLGALAKKDCPASGGRQMPNHYGHKALNIPTQSSPTGTQFLQAVGVALALKKQKKEGVVYVSSGEGTTSEGEFYEAVNWACREKLPVVFLIQNNKYAISVPVTNQNAGKNGSIVEALKGFENLLRLKVDGTDFFKSKAVAETAFKYARNGFGPSIVEANVVRLMPHSSSDDHKKYKTSEEIENELKNCPLKKFENILLEKNVSTILALEELKKQIEKQVEDAADWALSKEDPSPDSASKYVYDESGFSSTLKYEISEPSGKPIVMVDAINHALKEELERNDKIYVFGEDIADPKGGVFTATRGLSSKFGEHRVFNSPLAEASIVGVAIGMALAGLKPIVEIQFGDYIWPAFMQIRDELAMIRYRSNNFWEAPVVIRVPVGGYIHGGLYHSQNIEAFFAHIPGIYIAFPSNAADAKGLLKTAARIKDPVLFLEHKALYRQTYAVSPEPDANYLLPFGKAKKITEGNLLTIISYGQSLWDCYFVSKDMNEINKEIEIIDLRTLNPLDEETIYKSVKKTGKVLIVHEDTFTCGFGAELAARISENCFEYLDAPVQRIAALDTPIPYSPILESSVLPTRDKIKNKIIELIRY